MFSLGNLLDIFAVNFTSKISNIIFALVIFIFGFIVSRLIKKYTSEFLIKLNMDQPLLNYTSYSIYIVCLLLTTIIALSIMEVPQTTIFSAIGVIGVSLGIAFKETLSNIGSGYILLFLKPFKINDYIEFEGIEGTVADIHIFNTTLKTVDNKSIIIPNSKLINQNIINYTKQDKRRIDIKFNLPYGTDVAAIKFLINEVFKSESSIIKEANSIIGIRNFKDNGVEILATSWVNTSDYWDTYFSLTSKIEDSFRRNGIDMSVPQKIVYDCEKNKKKK